MLVQYLVGLCCLKWHPDAVDVTIGDMVLDPAASKKRDVDVTVTISESGSITHAFKAYEVKHESNPLDVADVEQLCLKLLDMPSVTHRAIVSASGFTSSAQSKAARHGVTLYGLRPWTRPLQEQFPALTMQGTAEECFPMSQMLLCWTNVQFAIVAREAKGPFSVQPDDRLSDASENAHPKHKTFADYKNELLLRSTEILFPLEPAVTISRTFPVPHTASDGTVPAGPAWPHTHTLDVHSDDVHVETGKGVCRIDLITISGYLQWQRATNKSLYYVMDQIPSGEAFAGALISMERREGHMTALVFSPKTRDIGIHFVRLVEKHLNCIRGLALEQPDASTGS
jgi:Restriction endonuclease